MVNARARLMSTAAMAVMLLSACAPRAPLGSTSEVQEERVPKTITIGIRREPTGLQRQLEGALNSSASANAWYMVHDQLTIDDGALGKIPHLAVELLSTEKGTWRINADGTMDTTWKFHQTKWHDGTPLTADDFLFAWTIYTDSAIPNALGNTPKMMQSATTPDSQTISIHWSTIDTGAQEAAGLIPMPKHLLEELYLRDKPNFTKSQRFTTEFIGVGPYRLANWVPGSHLELTAFDGYFRGRPNIDNIVLRFIGDPNTMVANVLAGAVDVILPPGPDVEAAQEIKERWAGTGNNVVALPRTNLTFLYVQFRPDYVRPKSGLTNLSTRQGFYHAIDRAALSEVTTKGLAPAADSWIAPTNPLRAEVESAIPKYPYDPSRAQRLITEGGWGRGADGVLVHQATAERFEIEIRARGTEFERAANVVASDWKAVGAQPSLHIIPPALADDRSQEGSAPGALVASSQINALMTDRLDSRTTMGPENNWFGKNQGGYNNPRADAVYDQISAALDPRDRINLHRQLVQVIMGDVAIMPLYWNVDTILAVKGVKAEAIKNEDGWNIFEWDIVK